MILPMSKTLQRVEVLFGRITLQKYTSHITSCRHCTRFLDAPHDHTGVARLNNHTDPSGVEDVLNSVRNLLCKSLLDL